MSEQFDWDGLTAHVRAIRTHDDAHNALRERINAYIADRIAAHTKALIDEAGETERQLMAGDLCDVELAPKAAATIAALVAENERLRDALHDAIRRPMGVVPASADKFYSPTKAEAAERRRVTRAAALSDLIAGDAHLIDGDDGA